MEIYSYMDSISTNAIARGIREEINPESISITMEAPALVNDNVIDNKVIIGVSTIVRTQVEFDTSKKTEDAFKDVGRKVGKQFKEYLKKEFLK